MTEVAVQVRDLRVRRGKKLVFDGIDLAVPRGQITGMLGPSGCGKTTLMRSIVGVQKLAGGSVEVLGIALLGEPELLVLDEPTVGLDPVLRIELWDLFRSIAAEGTTILVSSHVMDEALRCDRLLLMRAGAIIADTTPAGLLESTGTTDPEAAFLALLRREPVVPIRMRLRHRIHPADTRSPEKSDEPATHIRNDGARAAAAQPRSAVDRADARGPEPARWAVRVALRRTTAGV